MIPPGEENVLPPAIRLSGAGNCPHCHRLLTGLANNTCTACEGNLEDHWRTSPEVASRLADIAPGWTLETLEAWFAPLPGHFAWSMRERIFAPLRWYVSPDLASSHVGLRTRLEDRGREMWLDDEVAVTGVRLAAISDFRPFLALRVWGTRTETQGHLAGASHAFMEFWILQATGNLVAPDQAFPRCGACGGPAGLRQSACTYCSSGLPFDPGPWQILGYQSIQHREGNTRSVSGLAVPLGLVP